MNKKIPESWSLSLPEIEKIYTVEVEQANKLRMATPKERRNLYSVVYEEYFHKLPFHPQLTYKNNNTIHQSRVDYQLRQIFPFVNSKQKFLELGAGDCSLSVAVSKHYKEVIALEVSNQIPDNSSFPANTKRILFNGFDIPVDSNTIDVVFSNHLMEHIHPDDTEEQLKDILRVLCKGGMYICITPNRISGPHDISQFFTDKPVGFHLREYSATELRDVFLRTGFHRVIAYTIIKGRKIELPFLFVKTIEQFTEMLPVKWREPFVSFRPIAMIFDAVIAAIK